MKKTIKLAVVAALALGTTSAFATNGSNLIAMGAKARGMGGVGIGISHGAESAIGNAAGITKIKSDNEISFGGTVFMPDVTNTNQLNGGPAGDFTSTSTSGADMSVIPEVSLVSKVNDNFYMGVGMWGTAGMGVDYRGVSANGAGQMNMVTNLQLMQFGVPMAYTISGFTAAITPVLQYGSLDIDYAMPAALGGTAFGSGVSQDLEFGYNLGLSYEIANFTVGAMYKSQIDMSYKGQLSGAMQTFGIVNYTNDELSTPEEMGIGVSYKLGGSTFALDYKKIKWSDAKGYEDFKWKDQNVYALGYEYATNDWAVRLGYNYAKSPIEAQVGYAGSAFAPSSNLINTFNLLGFPGIVESHYTIGGSYSLNEKISFDLAYVYSAENKETFQNFMAPGPAQYITTKHSQDAFSVAINYNF